MVASYKQTLFFEPQKTKNTTDASPDFKERTARTDFIEMAKKGKPRMLWWELSGASINFLLQSFKISIALCMPLLPLSPCVPPSLLYPLSACMHDCTGTRLRSHHMLWKNRAREEQTRNLLQLICLLGKLCIGGGLCVRHGLLSAFWSAAGDCLVLALF